MSGEPRTSTELIHVGCTYGLCAWKRTAMSARAAELAFESHEGECPHRRQIITSSAGFYRCVDDGCDYLRWHSRGKEEIAEQHRVIHQRAWHQDPAPQGRRESA